MACRAEENVELVKKSENYFRVHFSPSEDSSCVKELQIDLGEVLVSTVPKITIDFLCQSGKVSSLSELHVGCGCLKVTEIPRSEKTTLRLGVSVQGVGDPQRFEKAFGIVVKDESGATETAFSISVVAQFRSIFSFRKDKLAAFKNKTSNTNAEFLEWAYIGYIFPGVSIEDLRVDSDDPNMHVSIRPCPNTGEFEVSVSIPKHRFSHGLTAHLSIFGKFNDRQETLCRIPVSLIDDQGLIIFPNNLLFANEESNGWILEFRIVSPKAISLDLNTIGFWIEDVAISPISIQIKSLRTYVSLVKIKFPTQNVLGKRTATLRIRCEDTNGSVFTVSRDVRFLESN